MRVVRHTKNFRRDYNKLMRSGWKIARLDAVMDLLIDGMILSTKHKDHALQGSWQGVRDCHIESDWLLLYEIGVDTDGTEVINFHATGSHAHVFG